MTVRKRIRDQKTLVIDELLLKAWLFGFLAGDGSLEKFRANFDSGLDREVAEKIAEVLNRLYSRDGRPVATISPAGNGWRVRTSRVEIVEDILKSCSSWWDRPGRRGWTIPDWVLERDDLLCMFLSGLSEADGSVSLQNKSVYVVTTRFEPGADDVIVALRRLGIRARKYTCGKDHHVRLASRVEMEKYAKLCPFLGTEKQSKLEAILASYGSRRRLGDFDKAAPIVEKAISDGMSPSEVAVRLDQELGGPCWSAEQVSKIVQKHGLKGYGKGKGTKQYIEINKHIDLIRKLAETKTADEACVELAKVGLEISAETLRHSAKRRGIVFRGVGGKIRAREPRRELVESLYQAAWNQVPGQFKEKLEQLGDTWTAETVDELIGKSMFDTKELLLKLLAPRVIRLLGSGEHSAKEVGETVGLGAETVTYLWKKHKKLAGG